MTRQDRGIRLQLIEKDFPRQAPGAPGRQIEVSPARRFSGFVRASRSVDQPAIDQRSDNGAQERHGYWNAENAHGLPDLRSGAI